VRDRQFFVCRNYEHIDPRTLLADPAPAGGIALLVERYTSKAQPVTDGSPDFRRMLTDTSGEHKNVEAA
jgi:hypothetical protein